MFETVWMECVVKLGSKYEYIKGREGRRVLSGDEITLSNKMYRIEMLLRFRGCLR